MKAIQEWPTPKNVLFFSTTCHPQTDGQTKQKDGDKDCNLRTNSSEEGGNDEDIGGGMTKATNLEDIQGLGGPMTRAKAKKAKEALNLLVTTLRQAQVQRKKRPK